MIFLASVIFALLFFYEILSHNYSNSVRKFSTKTFSFYYPTYFFGNKQTRCSHFNIPDFVLSCATCIFHPVLTSYISQVLTAYIFSPKLNRIFFAQNWYLIFRQFSINDEVADSPIFTPKGQKYTVFFLTLNFPP